MPDPEPIVDDVLFAKCVEEGKFSCLSLNLRDISDDAYHHVITPTPIIKCWVANSKDTMQFYLLGDAKTRTDSISKWLESKGFTVYWINDYSERGALTTKYTFTLANLPF